MRKFWLIILMVSFGILLPMVLSAGEVVISAPEKASKSFTSAIEIDAGSHALGAFEITLYFNPKVISVNEVLGGKTKEFSRAPIVNIDNKEGVLFLTSFQAESLSSPKGAVNAANISFKVIGVSGDQSPLTLEVTTLVDANGEEITNSPVSGIVTVK